MKFFPKVVSTSPVEPWIILVGSTLLSVGTGLLPCSQPVITIQDVTVQLVTFSVSMPLLGLVTFCSMMVMVPLPLPSTLEPVTTEVCP